MASAEASGGGASPLVQLSYAQLTDPQADLSAHIEAAFGPDGLGICVVDGVPDYEAARAALLPLATALANLPADELAALEDPDSSFNFGWSHGKERLEGDRADTAKGSFYANPLLDAPTDDVTLQQKLPHFCRPNVWPTAALPALEPALKNLGALICSVGLLLARHCDAYVARRASDPGAARMERTIAESRCCKSRLLHYFPRTYAGAGKCDSGDYSSWCGWHLDHGSLTGLTCASFYDSAGNEVPSPDDTAGLYIRSRSGAVVRARFGPHQLAFQMGEATQVHSGGLLVATPHCVRAPSSGPAGIARNTFAVFMQPHFDAPMDVPPGCSPGVVHWAPGQDFGGFSAAKVAQYYKVNQS